MSTYKKTTSPTDTTSFETIYQQNKNRIHYQLHKLSLQDPHNEFFTEGIYAMWQAYKKYEPIRGPMGTYFNFQIRYRLLDMLRRKTAALNNADAATKQQKIVYDNGNTIGIQKVPVIDEAGLSIQDTTFWLFVRARLTASQWKWVDGYIINNLTQHDIAHNENVTIDTVKSWARESRKKLSQEEARLKQMM